ncbi:hypothetical protein Droror1_Dr00018268 [Drosera rotundifolia]
MGEIEKRNEREEKRSTHREMGGSEASGCVVAAFGLRSPTLQVCDYEEEKSRRPRVALARARRRAAITPGNSSFPSCQATAPSPWLGTCLHCKPGIRFGPYVPRSPLPFQAGELRLWTGSGSGVFTLGPNTYYSRPGIGQQSIKPSNTNHKHPSIHQTTSNLFKPDGNRLEKPRTTQTQTPSIKPPITHQQSTTPPPPVKPHPCAQKVVTEPLPSPHRLPSPPNPFTPSTQSSDQPSSKPIQPPPRSLPSPFAAIFAAREGGAAAALVPARRGWTRQRWEAARVERTSGEEESEVRRAWCGD